MKTELNRYIELLKKLIAVEEAKEMPDVERLETLQEHYFYLDKSVMAVSWLEIDMLALEADRLNAKSEGLMETIMTPIVIGQAFEPDDLNDSQKLGH